MGQIVLKRRVKLKEYHFYISDDRCHDLAFVQHSFQLFYNHQEDNNLQMEQHCIWSDGCVGKFKNSRVFQWLCILHKRNKVPHIWNYFETGHRKGEHDGAGAYIKTALCRKEMKFIVVFLIWDEKIIVEWCSLVMGEGARRKEDKSTRKAHVQRYFWELVDVDWLELYECKTVQGTHAFHLVRISNNAIVEM